MTPPLIGLAFQNAIIFGLQGQFRRLTEDDSIKNEMICGGVTGATQAIITGPIELAKIKLQIQGTGGDAYAPKKYTGPIQTILKIREEEGVRGCFRGTIGVLARDVPGTAMYFGSFAYINSKLIEDGKGPDSLGTMHLLFSGGCAGMLSWATNYPIDVVKTRIQAEGLAPHGIYTSYSDCILKCLKSDGVNAFFQGFGATMLRAFPVNAAILATVTLFIRYVNRSDDTNS